jgi:hypothetical protein
VKSNTHFDNQQIIHQSEKDSYEPLNGENVFFCYLMRYFCMVLVIVVSACSPPEQTELNSPLPLLPQGVSGRWISPNPGARFIFKNIGLDTGTGIYVPTMTFDTLNFLSKGEVDGKQNVESFLRFSGFQQFRYIAIEDNNDISNGQKSGSTIFWNRYPTAIDTAPVILRTDSGGVKRFVEFFGSESISVPAGKYFTYKVRDSSIRGGFTYSLTYWFAPAIGCYARWTQYINNIGGSPPGVSTATSTLIEYKP